MLDHFQPTPTKKTCLLLVLKLVCGCKLVALGWFSDRKMGIKHAGRCICMCVESKTQFAFANDKRFWPIDCVEHVTIRIASISENQTQYQEKVMDQISFTHFASSITPNRNGDRATTRLLIELWFYTLPDALDLLHSHVDRRRTAASRSVAPIPNFGFNVHRRCFSLM